MKTALYRHYDAAGQLLYVGISIDPFQRWNGHRHSSWSHSVARIDLEWFADRSTAQRAEVDAVRTEVPAYNADFNRTIHRVAELLDKGMTVLEISRLLTISPQAVYRQIQRHKLPKPSERVS